MTNYNKYEPEFKEKILRLHLEEGRTKNSLTEEYQLGQGTITYWLQQRRKECQANPSMQEEIRSDTVWNKTKKAMTDKGLPLVIDVVKDVASAIIAGLTQGVIRGMV